MDESGRQAATGAAPTQPTAIPPERQTGALAAAMTRAWRPYRWRAYVVGIGAGLVTGGLIAPLVTATLGLGLSLFGNPVPFASAWEEAVWSVTFAAAFAVAGATAVTRWLPPNFRAATETYVWLADRAEENWHSVFGAVAVPRGTARLRAFLASQAETPATAGQLASAWTPLGELERARSLIGQMPSDSPSDRFASAAATWLLEFVSGTGPPLTPLETLAAAIDTPRDREEAEIEIAVDRARAELAAGRDWKGPLALVRARLGNGPLRPVRRIVWWPAFRGMFAAAILGVATFWLLTVSRLTL